MKKILALIAVITALLAWGSQIDDPLSDEALSLLQHTEGSGDSEAYLYLLGIDAPPHADPIESGRQLYEEYRHAEEDETYQIKDAQAAERLALPEGDFFCRTWEEGCLASLFTTEIDLAALLSDQAVLVERVNALHGYSEYRTLTKATIREPFPRYRSISAASRLKIASAIVAIRAGDAEAALQELMGNINILRKQMAMQDQLVGKMVYLMLISEHLDVASILLSEHQELPTPAAIPRLTLAEKRFDAVMAREFAMAYHTYKALDRSPDFWEMGGNAPGWEVRAVYKPNMTINAEAPRFIRAVALSKLEPHELVHAISQEDEPPVPTWTPRNVVGRVLANMSHGYDDYIARFSDLDVKIHVFNQLHHHNKKPEEITNPYFEAESAFLQHGRICLDGPLADERNLRCLPIQI